MAAQENVLNNRYQLVAQHGSGGMSVIYKALDLELGRQVAVKILRPSLTTDPTFLKRFRLEARNVANLEHPNIVRVYDVGQDGNTHYIVMELVDGSDLKKVIRADAPYTIDRALAIAIQICDGIGYAHRAGLVHADVKPQNVLMMGKDTVKVTDFGIAQALANIDPNARQKVVWGSPHYFSPEQAQGRHPTPASDVYSIGIVLFEMLTGRLPFMGSDQQELALAHIRQPAPHVHEVNPSLPEQLDRIIQKVLSKEPNARYKMADQLKNILVTYRDQGLTGTTEEPKPVPRPSEPEPDPHVWVPHEENDEHDNFKPPSAVRTQVNPKSQKTPEDASAVAAVASSESAAASPTPSGSVSPFGPTMTSSGASSLSSASGASAASAANIPAPTQMAQQPHMQPQPQPVYGDSQAAMLHSMPLDINNTGYTDSVNLDIDTVTLLLGFIAFLAVMGMVILWIFVFQAYT